MPIIPSYCMKSKYQHIYPIFIAAAPPPLPLPPHPIFSSPSPRQGCLSHPSFGYVSDKKARRCAKHRLAGMEGVKGRKKRPREVAEAAAASASAADTTTNTTSCPSSSSASSSPAR